jgi:MurNAc alpha-1-phosphate uridylyltransferase
MILAAGLGERMRPLTDHTPKPLLQVAGRSLIDYHLERLADAGFGEVVINVSHLARQIEDFCAGGERWGLEITYSAEESPLETAGGICNALPLLGESPVLVVNGDIWCDYSFGQLLDFRLRCDNGAHLVFVDNPPQHPDGDFVLQAGGGLRIANPGERGVTYAGIGVYSPAFFGGMSVEKLPLRPLLDAAIEREELTGEHFEGRWEDVGTPGRLAELDQSLQDTL